MQRFGSKEIKQIAVVYLGTKGGGPVITETLCNELSDANIRPTIFLSMNNEKILTFKKTYPDNLVELPAPNTFFQAINPLTFARCYLKVRATIKSMNIKSVLIPMHHPYTVLMVPFLRVLGVKVLSAIHDFKAHEGDNSILLSIANAIIIIFSSNVLFFSPNQLRKASGSYPSWQENFITLRLPTEYQRSSSFSKSPEPKYDFIFFGRLEPYKGLARLKKSWQKVLECRENATLLIRGNGTESKDLIELAQMPGVNLKIRYVEDSRLEGLMEKAKVVLAPYDSATQSGITGIAATFGLLAVTTPCTGFIEQAKYNPRIMISNDFSSSSFAELMVKALDEWSIDNMQHEIKISSGISHVL